MERMTLKSVRLFFINITPPLLILLWIYAAASKLVNFEESKREMLNQVFNRQIALILAWAVPAAEIFASILLLLIKTRITGLYVSFALLLGFSAYIGLVLSNSFGRIPCSCGGVLEKMGWGPHLAFNLSFLLLTALTIYLVTNMKGTPPMGKE